MSDVIKVPHFWRANKEDNCREHTCNFCEKQTHIGLDVDYEAYDCEIYLEYIGSLYTDNKRLKEDIESLKFGQSMIPKSAHDAVKSENEKLRECVEFYADVKTWCSSIIYMHRKDIIHPEDIDSYTGGKLARQTLEELTSGIDKAKEV